jgi:hypothetical protein
MTLIRPRDQKVNPGDELCKRFRILVEAWGEGWRLRSGDPMIGESRVIGKPKPLPLINTDDTDQEWVIGTQPGAAVPHGDRKTKSLPRRRGDAENRQGRKVETARYPLITHTSTAMPTMIR